MTSNRDETQLGSSGDFRQPASGQTPDDRPCGPLGCRTEDQPDSEAILGRLVTRAAATGRTFRLDVRHGRLTAYWGRGQGRCAIRVADAARAGVLDDVLAAFEQRITWMEEDR